MRRLLIGLGVSLAAASATATNGLYMPSGTGVTAGSASNAKLGTASSYNPAATYFSTNRARFSLFNAGVGLELGGGQELYDAGIELQERLEAVQTQLDAENLDAGATLGAVSDFEESLNTQLEAIGNNFYVQPGVSLSLPFLPLQLRSQRLGAFSVSVSSYTAAKLDVLHDEAVLDIDVADLADGGDIDPLDFLRTTSSVYAKAGQLFNVGLGYSRPVYEIDRFNSQVVVGGRGTLVANSLTKHLYPVKDFVAAVASEDGDVDEVIAKLQDDGLSTLDAFNYNFALDLGVMVMNERGHLGFTAYNLNAPKYEFNALGGDCAALDTELKQTECYHAEFFASIGDISLAEVHRVNPLLTVDGGVQFFRNQVALAASADLWEINDLFGRPKQLVSGALLLQPNFFAIPSLRFGLQKNLADINYTNYSMGLSLFRVVQIDASLAANLGNVLSGDESEMAGAVRGASVSAGFDISF
ncbi:conjugal transfer protein TraF [Salinibius halmophilus]|uniref:conjugal transfer protein TraF n=1 Tax=Salinibius halmophilus TaxID=1853216 RepID=UPI000E66B29E|nr:conjugal transfer protein TraF [Salinibius halmophilus]